MFGGTTYKPEEESRLVEQLGRVRNLLLNAKGGWVDLRGAARAGEGTAGLTARARDLRKKKFGGFLVESKVRKGGGLHLYRIPLGEDGLPMRAPSSTKGGGPRAAQLPLGMFAEALQALGGLYLSDSEFDRIKPLYEWLEQQVGTQREDASAHD